MKSFATVLRRCLPYLLSTACLLAGPGAFADTPPGPDDAGASAAQKLVDSLKPQHGLIKIGDDLATLDLPTAFAYLSPSDTQRLLEQGWGNPPGTGKGTLGMIIPAQGTPLDEGAWGVVITYLDDGHVSDADANKIDYNDLLKQMQEAVKDRNEQRQKQGYEPITLVGWAEAPHYDGATHKIYWAKDLAFGNSPSHTLNYAVRVLGRKGVLELNAVSSVDQLPAIRESMKQVIAFTDFTSGNRYEDFNSSTDKMAAYGLAALVAGGIAAKAGLFAKLGVMLLALKKFIILGIAAVGAFFRKLFKRAKA